MSKKLTEEDCSKNRNTIIEAIELSTNSNENQEVPSTIEGKTAKFISTNIKLVLLYSKLLYALILLS